MGFLFNSTSFAFRYLDSLFRLVGKFSLFLFDSFLSPFWQFFLFSSREVSILFSFHAHIILAASFTNVSKVLHSSIRESRDRERKSERVLVQVSNGDCHARLTFLPRCSTFFVEFDPSRYIEIYIRSFICHTGTEAFFVYTCDLQFISSSPSLVIYSSFNAHPELPLLSSLFCCLS